jgi:PPOX class probable F420-dependent enzyme
MKLIPESHRDLLNENKKAFAFLGTIMKDGSPQVTPIWFNTEGDFITINSAQGRIKDKNMRERPTVAITITDPADPYRYLQLRGKVVEFTPEGADAHIDALSMKYTGKSTYQGRNPKEKRIKYKIQIEKVDAH